MKLTISSQKKSNSPKWALALFCSFFFSLGIYLGWQNLPGFLKANFVLLKQSQIIPALFEKNELDTLYLNIGFKDLKKIEDKRIEAIHKQRLSSTKDDFVKAKISLNGNNQINCELRLKGHLSDHWDGEKYSLRINLKKDKLIKGMSTFSIQDPRTRSDTLEWIFLNHLREEGCMSLRYDFVNVIINGKKMGVYAMEEHFSKQLIEANKRRPGVIAYFDDYFYWKKYPPTFFENISWNSLYLSADPSIRDRKKIQKNPVLEQQANNAIELLRSLKEMTLDASKILNHDETGKYLAITRLWATNHGLGIDDIHFFFNPVTTLLEPIGFDGQSGSIPYKCFFSYDQSPWVIYALQDPLIANSYIKYLSKFCDEDYLDRLKEKLFLRESNFRKLILKEMLWQDRETIWKSYPSFDQGSNPWQQLLNRAETIRKELSEPQLATGYAKLEENSSEITLFIRNTTSQPVEIKEIKIGKHVLGSKELLLLNRNSSYFKTLKDSFVLKPLSDGELLDSRFLKLHLGKCGFTEERVVHVTCKFWGHPDEGSIISLPLETDSFRSELLPLSNLNPQLQGLHFEISDNEIFIKEGNFTIDENIYIPAGFKVILSPGTTLSFAQDSTFVSEGPIYALGTENKPIRFNSTAESWAGILLFNTKDCSKFKWFSISNVRGIGKASNPIGSEKNGWNMTGGMTVYKSPIELENCSFDNFQTEDALNIISSSFTMNKCIFNNTYSDAFDGDFVRGQLQSCKFSNINGDGVDFSGSLCAINDCSFKNIKDKAISVGEKSVVNVKNCEIDTVSFGVVSKDSSQTEVESGTTVKNASTAAFSAFQKKESFGPASIHVFDPKILLCKEDFLIQTNSSGLINSNAVPSTDFEVSQLYLK
jgi:hypothetical protein